MSEPILVADKLAVSYGKVDAVRGVSLAIAPGSIVSVIGANGAGKSTTLNALMGLLPSAGSIRYEGRDLRYVSPEARVAEGLCLVPEKRELFATMSVADNLILGGYRATTAQRAERLEAVYGRFPKLAERRAQLAGTLSGGERQMLAMGRALMSGPRVLMLDEPSLGLAPLIVKQIFEIIVALKSTGVSILLVEQNARAALAISDHAYVMELGELTMSGPAHELAANPRVIESYLGLGAETA